MHVRAIKANLSHMPLCFRCDNDRCGNDSLLLFFKYLFEARYIPFSLSYFQRVHQSNVTRILKHFNTIHN